MTLDFQTYKDKVMGCWAGKNIGGVLGAPFECKRGFFDVDFYTQDLSAGPPPNDDLDLQLIWLTAVERFGRNVNAAILGEYWLSYVIPHWAEYGTGKANMTAGLPPPLSGHMDNVYKDSCGCFIRSEIWACLAPGRPELAVRYAYEDAIVDHSGEGVYGEIFCAALQSAAFVESGPRKLIDIGLSYIPESCAVARCIKTAMECYDGKLPLSEARKRIHNTAPGTFGLQFKKHITEEHTEGGTFDIGTPGFDCPENIGFLIAGWLYGEGDFGKSLCAAVNCGEDTDCSAATLGAILGIIMGAEKLPEEWTAPLGGVIATLCINHTSWGGIWIPKNVAELTDRVLRVTPRFLDLDHCDLLAEGGYALRCLEGDALYCAQVNAPARHNTGELPRELPVRELVALSPNVVRYAFPTHVVLIDYGDGITFDAHETRKLKITVINNRFMYQQMWCTVKAHCPQEGVYAVGGNAYRLPLGTLHAERGEAVFEINASAFTGERVEILFEILFEGRHTHSSVRAVLLRKNNLVP
jgi:ADP-ribosylglycohydrolase